MARETLPSAVKKLFWDLDSRALRWDRDQEQIIGRILASGPWETVKWLRATAGDEAIRSWIEEHEGRGLSPQQLRFWQVIAGIPRRRVDAWLKSEGRQVWDRRAFPDEIAWQESRSKDPKDRKDFKDSKDA